MSSALAAGGSASTRFAWGDQQVQMDPLRRERRACSSGGRASSPASEVDPARSARPRSGRTPASSWIAGSRSSKAPSTAQTPQRAPRPAALEAARRRGPCRGRHRLRGRSRRSRRLLVLRRLLLGRGGAHDLAAPRPGRRPRPSRRPARDPVARECRVDPSRTCWTRNGTVMIGDDQPRARRDARPSKSFFTRPGGSTPEAAPRPRGREEPRPPRRVVLRQREEKHRQRDAAPARPGRGVRHRWRR